MRLLLVLHLSLPSKSSRTPNVKVVSISYSSPLPVSNPILLEKNHHLTLSSLGEPVSHQFAKEILVGLAGAEIDKLAETRGMDFIDREKAKHHAKQQAEHMYDQHYIEGQGADQYDP
jgi:hypothetical protein